MSVASTVASLLSTVMMIGEAMYLPLLSLCTACRIAPRFSLSDLKTKLKPELTKLVIMLDIAEIAVVPPSAPPPIE